MKKLIIVFLSVSLLLNSLININAADKKYYVANGYNDYYAIVVYTLQNCVADVTIRLNNYNKNTYDLNQVINRIEREKPELYMCYGGYRYNQEAYYNNQSFRIMHIHFSYRRNPSELSNIKQCNSYNQLINIITTAMNKFDTTLVVKVNNCGNSINISKIIHTILANNCDINDGYAGSKWRTQGTGNSRVFTFTFKYKFSKQSMILIKERVDKKARQIIAAVIRPGMSEYEKELAFHDYLVNNAKYDYVNYKAHKVPVEEHMAYGVLIKKTGVCDSYAKAMHKLLSMMGIKCIDVHGKGHGEAHTWNIVRINGKYYQLDATWDDPIMSNGKNVLRHAYFNITDSQMSHDHSWNRNEYPKCNSTAACFKAK